MGIKAQDHLALVLADYAAAYQLQDAGVLDHLAGLYVAIIKGVVAGSGTDETALRLQVSRTSQLHPERMAVIHVFDQVMIPR